MHVRALIEAAAERLKRAGVEAPRLEAESLLAHVLRRDVAWPLAHPEASVAPRAAAAYRTLVAGRARRIPYAYLVGERGFFGRSFIVTPATLVPRPETETFVEEILKRLPSRALALDVGTGSGAIGLTLAAERPDLQAHLLDVSPKALAVARRNARRLALTRRVRFSKLDILTGALPEPRARRPVAVVANLPYLPVAAWNAAAPEVRRHEPRLALVSGTDGLRHYRALFRALSRWKRAPELLALEAEPGQFKELSRLARELDADAAVEILKDLHGDERFLVATKKGAR